jgi:ankyrin repeat protein
MRTLLPKHSVGCRIKHVTSFSLRSVSLVAAIAACACLVGSCTLASTQQALIPAVLDNDIVKVQRLLHEPKIDVNWQPQGLGGTALAAAAERNFVDIMRLLLERGANPNLAGTLGMTPISSAAYHGHREAVTVLIRAGANLDVADKRYHRTALIEAAWKGHIDVVRMLVAAGANLDIQSVDNRRAVDFARQFGHKEIEAMLIAAEGARTSVTNLAI